MPREASLYVFSLLFCATIILNVKCTSGVPDRCSKLIRFDVDEIENYLSELNLTDVPTVKMMTAGFKCPISALPFGALKSDWARLLLLQEAQPDGSLIKLKLVRLMRILIIAYYEMEERIDVTDSGAKKSLIGKTTTLLTADETSQSHCPNSNFLEAGISSNNVKHRHCSCTDENDVTRSATKDDCSRMKSNATVIEIATMRNYSSNPTTVVPSNATRPNVTSLIDLDAATTYYSGNAKKVALKILGNCLKHSLMDTARPPSGKLFEPVKDEARYTERAARKGKEIDERGRDRTVSRISPSTNEFWRYVTFPTRVPLTVASKASAYRLRGLSGIKTGPWKSRKRTRKLNNDVYRRFRQFYGVDKNEEDTNDVFSPL